jgi:hypothetical protein
MKHAIIHTREEIQIYVGRHQRFLVSNTRTFIIQDVGTIVYKEHAAHTTYKSVVCLTIASPTLIQCIPFDFVQSSLIFVPRSLHIEKSLCRIMLCLSPLEHGDHRSHISLTPMLPVQITIAPHQNPKSI